MRVLVTGASGKLGSAVVRELVAQDHDAVGVDRVAPAQGAWPDGVRFVQTDLLDVGQVAYAMQGCAAVIHLGAVPAPYGLPDEVLFRNNTGATFATLQAASLLGVKRAAIASSGSAYGMAWAPQPLFPRYAPIDEAHPLMNHDAYGVGKEVDERAAEMFCRRDAMSVAALRFHWVATREEQVGSVATLREHPDQGANGLWGYVDLRDAARACRLAIEAAPFGFAPLNIVAADTLSSIPTEEAIHRFTPATELRGRLPGFTGGFAIARAQAVIGWEPEHSWRDQDRPV